MHYHLKVKDNLKFTCKISMTATQINNMLGGKKVLKY